MRTDALGEFPQSRASGQRTQVWDGNLPLLGCLVTSVTRLCFSSAFLWVRSERCSPKVRSVASPVNLTEAELEDTLGSRLPGWDRAGVQRLPIVPELRACMPKAHMMPARCGNTLVPFRPPSIQLPLSLTPSQIKIGKPERDETKSIRTISFWLEHYFSQLIFLNSLSRESKTSWTGSQNPPC